MKKLTHVDELGKPMMVDVGGKAPQRRTARAAGHIALQPETVVLIADHAIQKGNVLGVAELAGIQAAKRTADLIPLCHPLPLTHVAVRAELEGSGITIESEVSCTGPTGVEMEALTAVSVGLLTVYDMVKAVDKEMRIGEIRLLSKEKRDLA